MIAVAVALVTAVAQPPAPAVDSPPIAVLLAARQDTLPNALLLAARHDSLVGGRAAYDSLSSIRMLGTLSIEAAGIEAPLEILRRRPNHYVFRTVLGQGAEVSQGFDGQTAWALRPGGPRLLVGEERDALVQQSDFAGDLHDFSRFVSARTVSARDFNGRSAWEVELVRVEGDTLYEYFDREAGLSIGTRRRVLGPLGHVEERTLLGDYRAFGPLLIATSVVQRLAEADVVMRIGFVAFDPLQDAELAPPAAVRALVPR
ncbi:MAG: hypothetical protein KF709_04155 [Gemmatimonadaceae bacterium]|nr:hypothetical protein [Gemmatimonadaceae bacterium]